MARFQGWLRSDRPTRPAGLEVCRMCGADSVHPVEWAESGPDEWLLLLRCGACDTWCEVVASNRAVEAYDRVLDEGLAAIRAAGERLAREPLLTAGTPRRS